ncbi:MAG: glycosyltransferase [Acetanaerobacterium sp.]
MAKRELNEQREIMCVTKHDRRLLAHVPDSENIRKQPDRRGVGHVPGAPSSDAEYLKKLYDASQRYITDYEVKLRRDKKTGKRPWLYAKGIDTSASGMLVELLGKPQPVAIGEIFDLRFEITPGSMPEGFENKVKISAKAVRIIPADDTHGVYIAFEFITHLLEYMQKKKWRYSVSTASLFLFFVVFTIILMRAESLIYFRYNRLLYLYSLTAAIFLLSRYLFGSFYRSVPINPDFVPGVSIIIPCFNEEEWIEKTILGCINQDYPIDRLEVIVVDDYSSDGSVKQIKQMLARLYGEAERFKTGERVRLVVQEQNMGKRAALARGTKLARHELVVFVDSDSFLAPTAIKNLVQPFQDPRMGGVTGRTDVENKYTNMLTKMQAVRYYVAFRIMKAAEAYFDCVTCLSGPISCYRKDLVLKHLDAWLGQRFLGQPATFGDDRSMTNFVMRTHRTGYQDTAVCSTIVPSRYRVFLRQQMRWKRSWLRESILASRFICKKEPFMAVFFYMGLIVPIAAPVVVLYNLFYVPLMYKVFPTTFLMGLLLMALMMSLVDLWFRKSTLWVAGLAFCIYYEAVLLWQMPVAWLTFWKSTWGTRLTPQDIEADTRRQRGRFLGRKHKKGGSLRDKK